MKSKRDLKIDVKSNREFFDELKVLADRLDSGWFPEKPVERIYFDNLPSLLRHILPSA